MDYYFIKVKWTYRQSQQKGLIDSQSKRGRGLSGQAYSPFLMVHRLHITFDKQVIDVVMVEEGGL